MPYPEPISVRGLKDRRGELKDLGEGAHKALRVVFNRAGERIETDAERRIPVRSGRAKRSIRTRSTQTKARVVGGGARVPYLPWLDFGGRVGRNGSIERPFVRRGRYIYHAFHDNREEVYRDLTNGLRMLIKDSGLEE